jgi:hypothetical protein
MMVTDDAAHTSIFELDTDANLIVASVLANTDVQTNCSFHFCFAMADAGDGKV